LTCITKNVFPKVYKLLFHKVECTEACYGNSGESLMQQQEKGK